MELLFSAINALGTVGVLGYMVYKQDIDMKALRQEMRAERLYYRMRERSLLSGIVAAVSPKERAEELVQIVTDYDIDTTVEGRQ